MFEEIMARNEGKTLEFKRDLSSPAPIIKTIVAFANSSGGIVAIGIDNDTKAVLGVDNPLDEEERLASLIADRIEPRLAPVIEVLQAGGKSVLVIEVYPSGSRPHWVKREGSSDGVYVRLGSTNRRADAELIDELKRGVQGRAYDETPLPDLTADDIAFDAVVDAFSARRPVTRRDLESLRITARHQRRIVPTVGGMLLFGRNRASVFPDAWVQCGRFAGRDRAAIIDHAEIVDHLPTTVERVMEFLKKHAMRGADRSGLHRRDVWSIPLAILREAVVNAVVHADYSQKGAPIRVSYFDDRIEIENPGILLSGLTVDDILAGVSRLRNRVIGRVFRELGLIEQWGSGMRLIMEEAKRLGLQQPRIEELGLRFRLTIYLGPDGSRPHDDRGSVTGEATGEVTGEVERLVSALHGEMKRVELQEALGLRHEDHFRAAYLKPALEKGYLEMTDPDRPRSSRQRYRLTAKGESLARETAPRYRKGSAD